jgi:DNA adenine methylase
VAGDVVYLDPPYIPLTVTASFSKYAKDDFKELDQWALRGVIDGLISRGVRVLFSNSNTDLTRLIFGKTLTLYAVSAQRSIGASSASRIKVQEVLGISYSPTEVRDPKSLKNLQKLTTKAKG